MQKYIGYFLILLFTLLASCTQPNPNQPNNTTVQAKQETTPENGQPLSAAQEVELAFFHAARTGDTELMKLFIDSGVNVNFQNNQGYTGLMVAAFRGQPEIVDQLLAADASACLVDERGNTALMAAIVSGELSISRKLFTIDCDDQHLDNRSLTFANQFGQQEIATLLKQRQEK
ncbi:ankyrin repeat domain-containing protein [Spartinivicinus poritis]|uniref:Ankyrin repeat domain-containing protein n=1 Tax=Spartinivicinus poritis TaxID=2994640 RepID=A0ABT5U3C0_9GAMM|nr:ankyrin repeat domain-containing protein [Spartinivicinus sp. A2-2]MDE1460870.1 ankyrin repeat domain-containing protein [Spartinivicinus sp. A2-2]